MLYFGTLFYVSVLLINALAILNEERFLARIGWGSAQGQATAAAHNQPYMQGYDQTGYGGQQDVSVKARIITLIGAVRTLMRIPLIGLNLIIILYEMIPIG